jgi:hypothetical protein
VADCVSEADHDREIESEMVELTLYVMEFDSVKDWVMVRVFECDALMEMLDVYVFEMVNVELSVADGEYVCVYVGDIDSDSLSDSVSLSLSVGDEDWLSEYVAL